MNALRWKALWRKELLQMARDPSVLVVSFILPLALLLVFGYGLSMDLKSVPVSVTLGELTPAALEVARRFEASDYFDVTFTRSRTEAERHFAERKTEAMLDIPPGFAEAAARGQGKIGLTVHGVDASAAVIIRTYANAAVGGLIEMRSARGETVNPGAAAPIRLITRSWFNEANTSGWYLVPGLTIVILTLVSSFLGSILVAREWERGTMESLASTPATAEEILSAKFAAYFALSSAGAFLSASAAVGLFSVPVRGCVPLLLATLLIYNAWALAFGLFLSARLKRQFVAMQMAVIGSYLPALILSGFLFDLRSVPAWISFVGHLMPPTYAIETVKIIFLSGGSGDVVLRNLGILLLCTLIFLAAARGSLRKRLD